MCSFSLSTAAACSPLIIHYSADLVGGGDGVSVLFSLYFFFLKKRQILPVSLDETINTITKTSTKRQKHTETP
jgi:hypothetical protein